MSTIPESIVQENKLNKRITGFFKGHHVSRILQESNAYKSKGIPVTQVLIYLTQLVFSKKSMYMNIKNGTNTALFGKDVVYRLLNAVFINWTSYLLKLALSVIQPITEATSAERLKVLILDDTMYERPRSKTVELLANVHDHAAKAGSKFKRGFRMLTLGWSDGASFIPLMFRHMSSQNQKTRYNEINPSIDKRSVGYKARLQAISGTTEVLLAMLKQAKEARVPASHVLFDSWFSFPSTMMAVQKTGFDAVGRLKDTKKIKYLLNGRKVTLKEIYEAHKKRCGRAKYLLSAEVLLYNDNDETLPARLVFVRERNKRNKWIAFASTDMTLSEEAVIQLYGKRWDIEVFFKVCKSYLNLAKEFQGVSYDCITAHTAVVMTRYIMLAVDKRQNVDPRSLGELFFLCYDEVADSSFSEVITTILNCLHNALNECLFLSEDEIKTIVDAFIENLSTQFSCLFQELNHLDCAG
jgi:hypothetical protein